MSHIKYILIDEMSFIGEKLLENIDSRLRQAFPHKSNLSFGGVQLFLFVKFLLMLFMMYTNIILKI